MKNLKYNLIVISLIGLLFLTGCENQNIDLRGRTSNFWKTFNNKYQTITDKTVNITGDLEFQGEIKPDGALCSNGQILKKTGADNWDCASDLSGGAGGSGLWATTTNDMIIYPADTTDIVVIGANATSTTGNIFEVSGNSLFDNIKFTNASSTGITATNFWGDLTGNASTATSLASNGANCGAGQYPLGVDASGAVESCTTDSDTTYTAGGTLLDLTGTVFSLNEGTLTDTKGCKYSSGTGLVCDQDYLTSETDPVVKALTGIITSNGSTISSITDNHSNWDTAYSWGNHATAGYLLQSDWEATTTDALTEGTSNLYFTNARVGSYIDSSTTLVTISENIATATALANNGANCSSGQSPLGVDTNGAVEGCFDVWTEAENTAAGYISDLSGFSTDDLTEGTTNLYWTQARFDTAYNATTTLNGFNPNDYLLTTDFQSNWNSAFNSTTTWASFGTNFDTNLTSKTTDDLAEGTNLYYTDARVSDWFNASTTLVSANENIATATALANNPTDCSSNQFATTIDASGNLTCSALTDADIPDTITASNYLALTDWYATTTDALTEGTTNLYSTLTNIQSACSNDFHNIGGTDADTTYTAGTGLTLSTGAFDVNTSQNISTLSNLTDNGFVKTSGGTGALSVDTNTYLTGNENITLSGDITGSGATSIATTIGTNAVDENMLNIYNTPTDQYYLQYDTTNGMQWASVSGSGDVSGPSSATDNDVVFFDGTTGKLIKDSGLTLSGSNTGDQDLSGLALKTTTISTTAPLSGGGDLSANRTLTISQADGSTDGYLSSTDWTTFNNKADSDTTYTAGGTLLNLSGTEFSLNEGTLTDTKVCTYESATGLNCDHTDANTTYTAGTNLTLNGTQFDVDDAFVINSGSDTIGAGSGFTWTFDASAGTDPVMTFGDGTINISTGALQVGGSAVQTGTDLTDDSVSADELNADYGDFTCNGTTCSFDSNTIADNEIDYTAVTLNDLTFDVGSVSKTEFGYLDGVTSALQTQLDGKEETLTNSAGLRGALSDESGTGAAIFAGGNIGAGTATTPSADDNDTSIATTAYVQGEINGAGGTGLTCSAGVCNVDLGISIDISSETNLAAGRSLTMSGDSVEADTELYTDTKCIYFEDPTDADDFQSIWFTRVASTITYVWAESDQTVNLDLQVDDGTPADVIGTDIVADSTPGTACASGCDQTISGDATLGVGDRLDLAITSVSGTPTWVSICWTYTKND